MGAAQVKNGDAGQNDAESVINNIDGGKAAQLGQ
jgi:hypothetical protein